MFGNGGNDVLKGQAGKDLFDGGAGADDLVAGVDNVRDTFVYDAKADSGRTATTWDQLFQFDRSLSSTDKTSDQIDLRQLDADPAAGDQAFRFVKNFTTPTATQSDGQARVVDAGRHVNVEIDSNGDNTSDMILQVMNIDTLTGRDFLL
jgi:serralysin